MFCADFVQKSLFYPKCGENQPCKTQRKKRKTQVKPEFFVWLIRPIMIQGTAVHLLTFADSFFCFSERISRCFLHKCFFGSESSGDISSAPELKRNLLLQPVRRFCYTFLIGCLITVLHLLGATFLASDR